MASSENRLANGTTFPFGQEIVWQPSEETIQKSNLARFMRREGIDSYDALVARATDDVGWFWDATMRDLDVVFYRPYDRVLDLGENIAFPRWCVGGKLNIIDNCLDKWQSTDRARQPALIWEGEEGSGSTLTYRELHEQVCRLADGLRSLGLGKGDAVALYMPMTPEIVVAFLAIIKIGGIVLPLFSGYGVTAVSSRLVDAEAKAIFTVDASYRRGKVVPMKETIDEAVADVQSVRNVIVHRRTDRNDIPMTPKRDVFWDELMAGRPIMAETERTDAEDVLMLIYTSGTTGRPKGAVHTHCGFPIKAAQDMFHSMDLKSGEVMYWMSDMGWMMGPWLVFGTLLIGATMVLYDGAPDYPQVDRVWSLVERHNVTHLGVSPVFIRALKAHGTDPIKAHNLDHLRAIGSTGSPWDPESWLWLFNEVLGGTRPILNYSGGTEISGGILCGNFFKPLKPCAFSGPVPGMDADVVDDSGSPVRGRVGELVVRKPWIGMTRGFWRDRERYLDTYWRRFKGVWVHGDYAAIDADDNWYILGRSDDTIKVAGKRLGPAEVESIVNGHPGVAESAAIGVPDDIKGQALVVFCVLSSAFAADEDLRIELLDRVAAALGKPLRPREIKFVSSLPKTRNAKVMRRVIRATYLGTDPGNLTALEDPAAIDAVRAAL